MIQAKYIGEPDNISRFGVVEPGDVKGLTDDEWACVEGSGDWEIADADTRADKRLGTGPQGTPQFDLRAIDWSMKNLDNYLSNQGKHTLCKIAKAMDSIGLQDIIDDHLFPVKDIVSSIISAARIEGWHRLTKGQRMGTELLPEEFVNGGLLKEPEEGISQENMDALKKTMVASDDEGNPLPDDEQPTKEEMEAATDAALTDPNLDAEGRWIGPRDEGYLYPGDEGYAEALAAAEKEGGEGD